MTTVQVVLQFFYASTMFLRDRNVPVTERSAYLDAVVHSVAVFRSENRIEAALTPSIYAVLSIHEFAVTT